MPFSIELIKTNLINNLLFAHSQKEVKQLIDEEIKKLEQEKISSHFIAALVDQAINKLESFDPMKKDAQQWSNISIAKILFNRIKYKLKDTVT